MCKTLYMLGSNWFKKATKMKTDDLYKKKKKDMDDVWIWFSNL